jgi:hypothetical protein
VTLLASTSPAAESREGGGREGSVTDKGGQVDCERVCVGRFAF